MNRAKQLESLKGMKFMQRKAEAQRLEESAAQYEQAAIHVPVGGRRGPTIITDDACDAAMQVSGRRVFTKRIVAPPAAPVAEEKTAEEKEADAWMAGLDEGDVWDETAVEAEAPEKDSKPQGQEGKRFVVDGAIRAPPMPKRLREMFEDEHGNPRGGRRTESD